MDIFKTKTDGKDEALGAQVTTKTEKKKKAPVTSYLNQWIERRLAILTQSVLHVTAHIVTIKCYFNTIT